jgi:hypothetical protein
MILELKPINILSDKKQVVTEGKFLRFLNELNLPIKDFTNIEYFKIPKLVESEIRASYYSYIREVSYTRQNISYEDFLIAFLGDKCELKVISYDHHLLELLRKHFKYDCIWPEDSYRLKGENTVFLDANIILGYPNQSGEVRKKIISMLHNNSLTFLVPYCIIEEVERVTARIQAEKKKKHKHKFKTNYDQHHT